MFVIHGYSFAMCFVKNILLVNECRLRLIYYLMIFYLCASFSIADSSGSKRRLIRPQEQKSIIEEHLKYTRDCIEVYKQREAYLKEILEASVDSVNLKGLTYSKLPKTPKSNINSIIKSVKSKNEILHEQLKSCLIDVKSNDIKLHFQIIMI
jgi:hypothetical protein